MTPTLIPFVLKVPGWPDADQSMWDGFFAEGSIFEGVGPYQNWSEGTRAMRRQCYGQWLSFVKRTDPEALGLAPVARITWDRVGAFVFESQERLAPASVLNLVLSLRMVASGAAPHADWRWLDGLCNRFSRATRSGDLKPALPIKAGEVFDWSVRRMEEVEADRDLSAKRRALEFRDALMIGLLISCPQRTRAFMAIRLGRHLVEIEGGYELRFWPQDTKDKRAHIAVVPDNLADAIHLYLEIHRPILLDGSESDWFWIAQGGGRLSQASFTRQFPETMKRHFGPRIGPHAFRHIAATSIAELAPEQVNIIRDVLGHATLAMSERHYNRASANQACNRLQGVVREMRGCN